MLQYHNESNKKKVTQKKGTNSPVGCGHSSQNERTKKQSFPSSISTVNAVLIILISDHLDMRSWIS